MAEVDEGDRAFVVGEDLADGGAGDVLAKGESLHVSFWWSGAEHSCERRATVVSNSPEKSALEEFTEPREVDGAGQAEAGLGPP